MNLLRTPRRVLAVLLSALALATAGTLLPAGTASADPVLLPPPPDVLCIDLEGTIQHCPLKPCDPSPVESYPRCDWCLAEPPGTPYPLLCPIPFDPPVPWPGPRPIDPPPAPRLPIGVLAVKDFTAFVNAQPGAERRLIVTGTVVVSSPAVSVRLRPTNPQGFNPRILLLDAVVTHLPRIVPQIIREVPVRFESTAFVDLDEVNIPALGLRLPVSEAV